MFVGICNSACLLNPVRLRRQYDILVERILTSATRSTWIGWNGSGIALMKMKTLVVIDGELAYSKLKAHRFPEVDEIKRLIKAKTQ